jgi:hypothetical protein
MKGADVLSLDLYHVAGLDEDPHIPEDAGCRSPCGPDGNSRQVVVTLGIRRVRMRRETAVPSRAGP